MFYTFKPCNIKPKTMVKCTQAGIQYFKYDIKIKI